MVFANLRQRLSSRVAAAATALALFFVLCTGLAAWLVASGMMRAQAERQLADLARYRAVHLSSILEMVAGHVGEHLARTGEPGSLEMAGVVVDVRIAAMGELADWNKAAMILGVPAGRVSPEQGGAVEMMLPQANGFSTADKSVMWRLPLDRLAQRLALGGDSLGGEVVVRSGGRSARSSWGPPFGEEWMVAEAEVMLPNGFGRGQLLVRIGADRAGLNLSLGRYALWLSLIGAAMTALVVALATITSRRLTRRLSILADAATAFDFAAPEGGARFPTGGNDEVGRLGTAFAGMVERLDAAYRDLDRRSQVLLGNAERVAQVGSAIWVPGESAQTWSEQFHAILGLKPGDVVPNRDVFFDRVHPEDRGLLSAALGAALDGTMDRVVEDFRIIRGDGAERVAQFRAEVARDPQNQPVRVDATIQDITERKRMEEQLDGVVRDLKQSNEELEQFAYVASHDLRQPLRTVRSYLTLIEDSIEDKLDDETREFMDFIRDGVKRMDSLITDLLAYSRVGRRVTDSPVDVGRMIDLSMLDLQAEIDDSGAVISVPSGLPVVEGDSGELTRLFQNLLGNALKYRSLDDVPKIAVGCGDLGGMWHFSVADNGIGIDSDHRERVFGIFQRLHGRHEYEGTGIGLAICRKIVERQGGAIWIDASAAGGAIVHFTWPKMRRAPGTF